MNWLINIGAKLAGAGKYLAWFNGKKAYLGAAGLVLSGTASLLGEASNLSTAAQLFAFAKGVLASDGFKHISEGLAIFGIRHAVTKKEEPKPE